jgi:hypothetical protein
LGLGILQGAQVMQVSDVKNIKTISLCMQAIKENISFQKELLAYKAMDKKDKMESLERSDLVLIALINRKKFLQGKVGLGPEISYT